MSEWGRVIFYYDYELTDTSSVSAKNVRGLVSKAYKNIGVEGIITHAYSGIRYFLKRFNHKYSDYHMSLDNIHRLSDWEALNTVFDVFFEEEYVHLGVNDVRNVLDRWQDYKPESEQLKDELFNCEGTFGWLYMSFTGNARDGYVLKYGYEYQGDNLLLARKNLLLTFIDNMIYKFDRQPTTNELKSIAYIISWNIWQMDGLTYTAPYSEMEVQEEFEQLTLFGFSEEQEEITETNKNAIPCIIRDWTNKCNLEYRSMLK